MVTTTNQKATQSVEAIQCRWDREQGGRTSLLHGSPGTERRTKHNAQVLPIRPGGTQGHLGILVVRSRPTLNRLEEGVDRSHTAADHTTCPKCPTSPICAKNTQYPSSTATPLILYWPGNNKPPHWHQILRGTGPRKDPKRIPLI
jgi:hypothetical protein